MDSTTDKIVAVVDLAVADTFRRGKKFILRQKVDDRTKSAMAAAFLLCMAERFLYLDALFFAGVDNVAGQRERADAAMDQVKRAVLSRFDKPPPAGATNVPFKGGKG